MPELTDCYRWDPERGELVTAHPHFEGRCVVDGADEDFLERVAAYLDGGWDAWKVVKRRQRAAESRQRAELARVTFDRCLDDA
jgi:hypothetical protein